MSGNEKQTDDCDVAASWSTATASAAVTAAADCSSGKPSVALSTQGTVASLPSIGIIPSSPDVRPSLAGLSIQQQQSSVVQDHSVNTAALNDNQVCSTC